jgi:hypothetical protein
MALTRDFKQTIVERVRRDPALARCVQTTFRWMASLRPSTRRFAPAQNEAIFFVRSLIFLILSHARCA